MRILRILTRLNLGGPARQVAASDPLLVERGHTVRILCGTPELGEGDLFDTLVARGLDVQRVPGLRRGVSPARDLLVGRRLRRAIRAFQPDVVHTHASKAGALGRRAVAGVDGPGRIARVHTFHGHVLEGYFPETVSRRLRELERRLAEDTDRVVAVSHATGEDLLRLGVLGERDFVVVPPGIDLDPLVSIERAPRTPDAPVGPLRELIGAAPDDVVVGVVGRLAEVKRPTLGVDVFEALATRFPALHLVFIGDGSERRAVERRVMALPDDLQPRCHLLGAHPDPPAFLRELDVVLATSRSEGLPVALIEAAAAGLPVVATDVGGVSELVAHERTGFLGKDQNELIWGLGQLLDRPEERLAMGSRARLRVVGRHGAEALADRLEAVYRAAVGIRRGSGTSSAAETSETPR